MLRIILKVRDGTDGDYWWVECGTCNTAWQVPYYAKSVGVTGYQAWDLPDLQRECVRRGLPIASSDPEPSCTPR